VKGKTDRAFLFIFLAAAVCGQAFGLHQVAPSQPAHHATKHRAHLRRLLWNPVFRPSRESLLRQNEEIDRLEFHDQIQVNSAVRTVQVQKKLRRHNRNAAPEKGETASSHLAGITVDIQRRGMTSQQVAWMEQYLMPLRDQGLVEPEEERHQWVFHVAVSGRYGDARESNTPAVEQQDKTQDDRGPELLNLSFNADGTNNSILESNSVK
jgi:hypothetical protein